MVKENIENKTNGNKVFFEKKTYHWTK